MRRVLPLILLLTAGCGPAEAPLDQALWAERGAAAVKPFKQRLMAALTQGLSEGPVSAISVCRIQAPGIAQSISKQGLTVGRTSHKLRNPANAPKPWMESLLAEYQAAPNHKQPRVVRLKGGGIGYVEPIHMLSPCLKCHGAELAPEVTLRLAELYPEDQATGLAAGEFRGLFWVEFSGAD